MAVVANTQDATCKNTSVSDGNRPGGFAVLVNTEDEGCGSSSIWGSSAVMEITAGSILVRIYTLILYIELTFAKGAACLAMMLLGMLAARKRAKRKKLFENNSSTAGMSDPRTSSTEMDSFPSSSSNSRT
jgi:hypothetical protein